jgi:hypothetical protein
MLHVEAGSLRLDPGEGVAWIQDETSDRPVTLGADVLAAENGALVLVGNSAAMRAGADAQTSVLIITLLPADGSHPINAMPPAPS